MSSTLTGWNNQRTNFFSALLQAAKEGGEAEEPIFIDRDPECFRAILNYLRTGRLTVPTTTTTLQQLRVELAFYGVPEPKEWSQPFQQWAMGHPGEVRAMSLTPSLVVEMNDGDACVWKNPVYFGGSGEWQGPCKSLPISKHRDPRYALLSEMGQLGWELKAIEKHQWFIQMRP